jgi:hypothetical protein
MNYKGINGLLTAFVESVKDLDKEAMVTFAGSVGVCTPFVELLAYSVRNKGFEMAFIPDAIVKDARKMKLIEGIGYQVINEEADPNDSDTVVILGGLAMPFAKKTAEDILKMIDEVSNKKTKIIGVGFMGIFEKQSWTNRIDFDVVIDGTIDPVRIIRS